MCPATSLSLASESQMYVEDDMPGPSRMPFSAAPAKDGSVWIPNFGIGNKITRLDPKTGEMQDFPVPNVGTAAVHSAPLRAPRIVAHWNSLARRGG